MNHFSSFLIRSQPTHIIFRGRQIHLSKVLPQDSKRRLWMRARDDHEPKRGRQSSISFLLLASSTTWTCRYQMDLHLNQS